MQAKLGEYQAQVNSARQGMASANIMARIGDHDHTVWKPNPDEITNRLGWIDIADRMVAEVNGISDFVTEVRSSGYTHTLLMGMGGSSLAPEVFSMTFGVADDYLSLEVLDTTDADAVRAIDAKLDYSKTLFIVATKSGGTAETLSAFKYFYNRTAEELGAEKAGEHFAGITDPGSKLLDIGNTYNFRHIFVNDPNIGGRYSALSFFGLVPACLLGIDVTRLLKSAIDASANDAEELGTIMGELAKVGRDKITFITSNEIASFGDWVEQLIAESTGKEGKGIVPVVGEALGAPDVYGEDRFFVHLQLEDDDSDSSALAELESAGHPLVHIQLDSLYDLGSQFWVWEMATAVAGHHLNIQPFDQPNVESAKILARQMIDAYTESGELPAQDAKITDGDIVVYGDDVHGMTAVEALIDFLAQISAGDYVTLQPYVTPDAETSDLLNTIRLHIRDIHQVATTSAYGPRFLHSTGQLHKGDAGNGSFIQFTSDAVEDVDIPDSAGSDESSMTFGVLKLAQALGDQQALIENNRRVIRFHLGTETVAGLQKLTEAFE